MSQQAEYTPAAPPPVPPGTGGTPVPAAPDVLRTYRDAIREISPWWLRDPIGGAILYAIGAQIDELNDRLRAGVKLRFPGFYSMESLALNGRERRIRRGRLEPDATYAARLRRWLDDHRRRGNPYALLAQVHAFYAPDNFGVELRYVSGRNFTMDLAGDVVRGDVVWTPPGDAAQWARWWLIYQWPDPIDDDGLWGDPGTWGDGSVWGCGLSPEDIREIRLIPREWNNAHSLGYVTLVSPSPGITITISVQGA